MLGPLPRTWQICVAILPSMTGKEVTLAGACTLCLCSFLQGLPQSLPDHAKQSSPSAQFYLVDLAWLSLSHPVSAPTPTPATPKMLPGPYLSLVPFHQTNQ